MSLEISIMIVGAEKAGTSALISHLDQNPNIFVPRGDVSKADSETTSEFPFFLSDSLYREVDIFTAIKERLPSFFNAGKHIIAAKSVGICTDRNAMVRLNSYFPNCKIIFIMRDPIKRAISSHAYQLFRGAENVADVEIALRECIDNKRSNNRHLDYLNRGLYQAQVTNLIEIFGVKNCLFLCFDDVVSGDEETLIQISKFIGFTLFSGSSVNKVNSAKQPRSRKLARLLYEQSRLKDILRFFLPIRYRSIVYQRIRRLNTKKFHPDKPDLSPQLTRLLRSYFHYDLTEVDSITGLKLREKWGYE